MTIKLYEVEFMNDDDKKEGTIAKLLDQPVEGGKYNSFGCTVEIGGEKKKFSFNRTTLKNCVDLWGKDEVAWIGKSIKSLGIQKCGAMSGTVWTPVV